MFRTTWDRPPSPNTARQQPQGQAFPVEEGILYANLLGNAGAILTLVTPRKICSWHQDGEGRLTRLWQISHPDNVNRSVLDRIEDWVERNGAARAGRRVARQGFQVAVNVFDELCNQIDALVDTVCQPKVLEALLAGALGVVVVLGVVAVSGTATATMCTIS